MKKALMIAAVLMSLAAANAFAHDRDNNPPGPRGGRGTNWENPPGPAGGPGASPNRAHPYRHHHWCEHHPHHPSCR